MQQIVTSYKPPGYPDPYSISPTSMSSTNFHVDTILSRVTYDTWHTTLLTRYTQKQQEIPYKVPYYMKCQYQS